MLPHAGGRGVAVMVLMMVGLIRLTLASLALPRVQSCGSVRIISLDCDAVITG